MENIHFLSFSISVPSFSWSRVGCLSTHVQKNIYVRVYLFEKNINVSSSETIERHHLNRSWKIFGNIWEMPSLFGQNRNQKWKRKLHIQQKQHDQAPLASWPKNVVFHFSIGVWVTSQSLATNENNISDISCTHIGTACTASCKWSILISKIRCHHVA